MGLSLSFEEGYDKGTMAMLIIVYRGSDPSNVGRFRYILERRVSKRHKSLAI
tara:strand:+ start:210 stop:365 length:156 start_codon:yes stop_codon:yes gene_type:complete